MYFEANLEELPALTSIQILWLLKLNKISNCTGSSSRFTFTTFEEYE